MRILVFSHDTSLYGASRSLLTALDGLRARGSRDLHVLLPYPGPLGIELERCGIGADVVPFPRCITSATEAATVPAHAARAVRYLAALRGALPGLDRATARFAPDVVYTNTSAVEAGFLVARRHGVPHVWHVREIGENYQYLPCRPRIACRIRRSDRVIAVSTFVQAWWLGARGKRCHVVRNGIPAPPAAAVRRRRIGRDATVRLTLPAYGVAGKGQHIAAHALGLLKARGVSCSLAVYGDALDRVYVEEVRASCAALGLAGDVRWLPFTDDIERIYADTDVLLNCSLVDSLGRTVPEAMARGIPVICNRAGAIQEIVEHGVNGLLYDGTAEGLATGIALLVDDRAMADRVIAGALDTVRRFDVARYVDEIDGVLQSAARREATRPARTGVSASGSRRWRCPIRRRRRRAGRCGPPPRRSPGPAAA
ncbi:MAG: glycosyltransferase family 4 protein [Acidimicrobiia bacterium]|nr:glycosyltransferase family 4 protein [Acidimicrobiia bacterium]